jgi:hypothetical protein
VWRPGSGKSPNRDFVLVSEPLWMHYHRRRREIDQMFRGAGFTEDMIGACFGIEAERAVLRSEIRDLAKKLQGNFIVPV